MPNLVSLTGPSVQILDKIQTGISDFRISGQFFINENCHNSRTSHDINMKFGPVTKLDKKKTVTQKKKKKDDDVISENCDVIVFSDLWPICSHPEVGFRTHGLTFSFSFYLHFLLTFTYIFYITYIYLHFTYIQLTFSSIVTFYLTKPVNRTQLLYYCFK